MNLKAQITKTIRESEWDKKLLQNKASTTYQLANWPKIYSYSYDSVPVYLQVTNAKETLVAQLAAVIHSKLFWKDANFLTGFFGKKFNLINILNWSYGPIIHDKENFDEILEKVLLTIDAFSIKNKITMIHGTTPPLDRQFQNNLFKKHGYSHRPWATYIIDLRKSTDELYASLNKKTRYDIRKTETNNFDFEVVMDHSSFYDLMNMGYGIKKKKNRHVSLTPKIYDAHWKYLYNNENEKAFFVKSNNELIGGIHNLIFNGNVLQQSVLNPNKQGLGGNFLTWNAIKWSIRNKYLRYDMGGFNPIPSSEREKNIDFYKSKWGGKKYDFGIYTKIFDKTKFKILTGLKEPQRAMKKITRIIHGTT